PSVVVTNVQGYYMYGIYLNNKVAPLDKLPVRQAVNMALNREAWGAALNGQCSPLAQALPKGVTGYDAKLNVKTDFALATKMVADNGAPGASIKMLQYNVEPQNTLAKVAQAQLQAIGLNVELVPILSTIARATWRQGGYGMMTASVTSAPSPD